MNFRLTAALFGIVFVLGAILLVLSWGEKKQPPANSLLSELALAGTKTEDVESIEFERPGDPPLLIVRTDKERNTWQIQKPLTAGADAPKVVPIIIALLKAKPTPYPDISSNPAAHGLDPASLKITLRAGDKSSTVSLGDVTLGDKGVVFVTTSSQPKRPMAVRRSDLDVLFREPKDGTAGALTKWTADYRTSGIFPSDSRAAGEDVASVRLEMPNKKKELALTHALGGAWRFDSPAGWGDADIEGDATGSPGTFTGVRRLLGALTSVSAADPRDFIDQPKDLKEYGLDDGNPDLVKVKLTTRDGQSATVYFGKREGTAPPAMPPGMPQHAPGVKVYVRVEGQPGVIRATSGDLSGLNGVVLDPSSLRDRTLMNADRAKADGIDILLAGQPTDKPTKLRRSGPLPQWRLYGGPNDPQLAFGVPVEKLLDVVFASRSIKDFPQSNPANFAAVSATVFVWVDGFNPPASEKAEPVKKAEPIKIEFGRKDGETIYVRRTFPGQMKPDEFTIAAQLKVGVATETADVVTTVGLSRLDLLDRSLPSFSDAARIAVTGTPTYTLARDLKPDPLTRELLWRFDTADARKGQVADGGTVRNDIIYKLATANSSFGRFVDEDPKPEKLAEYGLATPRLKVVVDMPPDVEPKQFAIEFGKDATDPDKVYARVPGRPAVFTVQRRVFDVCANPDLRDRVVFRGIPAATVNKIELKGWGNAGPTTELGFEKNKEGVWGATKAPAGFVVDPVKVNAFTERLSLLQAKTFEKGTPQTVHGFGDPKHSLQVTLHWPGGAVALNLGATPDAGNTYYGWSGWLPQTEPVFTFEGAMFKPFKDKPTGFAK